MRFAFATSMPHLHSLNIRHGILYFSIRLGIVSQHKSVIMSSFFTSGFASKRRLPRRGKIMEDWTFGKCLTCVLHGTVGSACLSFSIIIISLFPPDALSMNTAKSIGMRQDRSLPAGSRCVPNAQGVRLKTSMHMCMSLFLCNLRVSCTSTPVAPFPLSLTRGRFRSQQQLLLHR